MNPSASILLAAGLMLGGSPALAAVNVYTASLSGTNEVPPAASPGTGLGTVTIDDVLNTMRVQVNFSGLVGNTVASHIHCCQPLGTNAQVATTTPAFPGFPLGVTSGTYDQTFDMTQASSYNSAFLNNAVNNGSITTARATLFNGIAVGEAYLNVHTNVFPGGEIRGQLVRVPEPASWALMIAGFGLLGGAIRTRRRAAFA